MAKSGSQEEDDSSKSMVSFMIIMLNCAAAGAYPMYRFVNAWLESGEIDRKFIANSCFACFKRFAGTKAADYLAKMTGCLERAQELANKAEKLEAQIRENEKVVKMEDLYGKAKSAKAEADNAHTQYKDLRDSAVATKKAAKDLRDGLGKSQAQENISEPNQESEHDIVEAYRVPSQAVYVDRSVHVERLQLDAVTPHSRLQLDVVQGPLDSRLDLDVPPLSADRYFFPLFLEFSLVLRGWLVICLTVRLQVWNPHGENAKCKC